MTSLGRIEIDQDACVGHARCLMIASDLFDLDDDGRAIVLGQLESEGDLEAAHRAALACPERAIRVDGAS